MNVLRMVRAAVVALALAMMGCSAGDGEAAASATPSPSTTSPAAASPATSPEPSAATPSQTTSGEAAPPEPPATVADEFGGLQDLPDPVAAVAEAGVEVSGSPIAAASWNDANGRNLAVLSTSVEGGPGNPTTRLFVAHHVLADGDSRRLREVTDFVEDCELDTVAFVVAAASGPTEADQDETDVRFENPRIDDPAMAAQVRGPLEVTDLDDDQIGELTFAYGLNCKGGVSPDPLKLIVLEDGEKYILRGSTWGYLPYAEEYGGLEPPEPEPAETDWPPALWQHAIERYDLYALD